MLVSTCLSDVYADRVKGEGLFSFRFSNFRFCSISRYVDINIWGFFWYLTKKIWGFFWYLAKKIWGFFFLKTKIVWRFWSNGHKMRKPPTSQSGAFLFNVYTGDTYVVTLFRIPGYGTQCIRKWAHCDARWFFHKKASYAYQYCKGNIFYWKYNLFSLFFNNINVSLSWNDYITKKAGTSSQRFLLYGCYWKSIVVKPKIKSSG